MNQENNRRSFLKKVTVNSLGLVVFPQTLLQAKGKSALLDMPDQDQEKDSVRPAPRKYNTPYVEDYLNRVAFPIGGIGAGMFCIEGNGAISHMSVRNKPELFNEPFAFAAISVKGIKNGARVLEGPVPDWKVFGRPGSGFGAGETTYGLPRFDRSTFTARFPFCYIDLQHQDIPLDIRLEGWSPFIPTDEDNSSLPAGAIDYVFTNKSKKNQEIIFSYHAKNFMQPGEDFIQSEDKGAIKGIKNGFIISQLENKDKHILPGDFAIYTDSDNTVVDHCWRKEAWWNPMVKVWETIEEGGMRHNAPVDSGATGASLYLPFTLRPGEVKKIRLMMAWYFPETSLRIGKDADDGKGEYSPASGCCSTPAEAGLGSAADKYLSPYHQPWYSGRYKNVIEVARYWQQHYDELYKKTNLFSEAFYASTHPPEVMEAIAANLTILKSPTVLRQRDGRLWGFEGSGDNEGSCSGSCTHVWNYAQAVSHLFPSMERTLRHTEFCENQDVEGQQQFRAGLPIRPIDIKELFFVDALPAADGQLGGIMKVYREWRIYGNNDWLKKMYPMVKKSLDFCIRTWDPNRKGILEKTHHNTYDIQFTSPNSMCTSIYLGALRAMIRMGDFLKEDITGYEKLYADGKKYTEEQLFNGEYFIQQLEYADNDKNDERFVSQYGRGCLSDGVLGGWLAAMCGLDNPMEETKMKMHLMAVHKYNFKKDLSEHVNTARPSYAMGHEGGLLVCTWPEGGEPAFPFSYASEVWTGIEYQVASHLIMMGKVDEGLEIVRTCRDRYDGRVRNPFNEYECGSWYARAMSSYGLLQALTGVRYDAVDKALYIQSQVGDFTSFLSTATGFGTVNFKKGKPLLKVVYGKIEVLKIIIVGKEMKTG